MKNNTPQSKKHIDVIVKYFYPVAGGIENNIMQTYTVLQSDFGFDVTIHTTANTYTEKNSLPHEEVIQTLRVKRYPSGSFGFKPKIDWASTTVVALHNFDVFFIRYMLRVLFLKITGRKKFAFILTPHGGFNPEWSMFSWFQGMIKKVYTYTIGAWLINWTVDAVRAVSEWEKGEEIKYITPAKVHMIDNGLEDEAYLDVEKHVSEQMRKKVNDLGDYIIQVGRVYPIKNFETAISCLQFIPKNIKLVIVGQLQDKVYEKNLTDLIQKLNLRDRVVFLGVVRGVDKYYLLRHARLMVHMALWESGCNVVREGMSQGLPCIVSNVYGLPGLVKDGVHGFCLPVHSYIAVAEKIVWILDPKNNLAVQAMRQANILFGQGQSWKEVARKMNNLYLKSVPTKKI